MTRGTKIMRWALAVLSITSVFFWRKVYDLQKQITDNSYYAGWSLDIVADRMEATQERSIDAEDAIVYRWQIVQENREIIDYNTQRMDSLLGLIQQYSNQ